MSTALEKITTRIANLRDTAAVALRSGDVVEVCKAAQANVDGLLPGDPVRKYLASYLKGSERMSPSVPIVLMAGKVRAICELASHQVPKAAVVLQPIAAAQPLTIVESDPVASGPADEDVS